METVARSDRYNEATGGFAAPATFTVRPNLRRPMVNKEPMMKSVLSLPILGATLCATALTFASPGFAADSSDAPAMPHHHHMMHGKHRMGMQKASADDAETEKLNEQSLQNAKGGMAPMSPGNAAENTAMPANGAMMAPGTGMAMPSSGKMGAMTPSNAPPITTPPSAASSNDK